MSVRDSRSYIAAYTIAVLCWMWCAFCLLGAVVGMGFELRTPGHSLMTSLLKVGGYLFFFAGPGAVVGWFSVRYCWRQVRAQRPVGFDALPPPAPVLPPRDASLKDDLGAV